MKNLLPVLAIMLYVGACSTKLTAEEQAAAEEQKAEEQKIQDDKFKDNIGIYIYVYSTDNTTSLADNLGAFNTTHSEYIPKNTSGAKVAKFTASTSTTTATYISTMTDSVIYTIALGTGTPKKGSVQVGTSTPTSAWFTDTAPAQN